MNSEVFRAPDRLPDKILRMTEVGCVTLIKANNKSQHFHTGVLWTKTERTNRVYVVRTVREHREVCDPSFSTEDSTS